MHAPYEGPTGVFNMHYNLSKGYECKTSPDTGSQMEENRGNFHANFMVQSTTTCVDKGHIPLVRIALYSVRHIATGTLAVCYLATKSFNIRVAGWVAVIMSCASCWGIK